MRDWRDVFSWWVIWVPFVFKHPLALITACSAYKIVVRISAARLGFNLIATPVAAKYREEVEYVRRMIGGKKN
jgi:hypothetical protein